MVRIDDRIRCGKLGLREVMVRDDDIHAKFACESHFFDVRDAAIDRYDELRAFSCKRAHAGFVQSVSFASLRHVGRYRVTDELEKVMKEGASRDAVAVVIMPDDDLLTVFYCSKYALDRLFHPRKEERVVTRIV